jgi:serine/threonine protein kinase
LVFAAMALRQRELDAEFARQALAEKRLTRSQLHECAGAQMGLLDRGIRRALPVLAFELGLLERPIVEQLLRHVLRRVGPIQIAGFSIVKQIGRGGMGVVYRGKQNSLNREVAVKLLLRHDMSSEFVRRFKHEGQIAARLRHNNLVAILEVGDDEGWHFIAMEQVVGPTLTQRVVRDGPMDEIEVVDMTAKIAAVLQHVHDSGIIHRDIKPGNIMFTRSGEPKLCDLGLARHPGYDESDMIARGVTLGSRRYMSPEQVRGLDNVDPRTDIYSLGLTGYFALTGHPPFKEVAKDKVMYEHLRGHLHWPAGAAEHISDQVSWIIMRMTAREAGERYETCRDLASDLENLKAELIRRRDAEQEKPEEPAAKPKRKSPSRADETEVDFGEDSTSSDKAKSGDATGTSAMDS